eukprot:TRINITY_DN2275_c0_g1_i7.p1 TRINITY_DN2275_c0_g1~~TRINITY_DN2275_c0_g1_i7.p1  ORF type:complete len:253 (+),score=68.02 TRINITY_DN2275_c0_g1_i7:36-761(+)
MAQQLEEVRVLSGGEEQSTDVREEIETSQTIREATDSDGPAAQNEMEAAQAELKRHLEKHSNVDDIVESGKARRLLHIAARDGKSKLAELLLEEGANVDIQENDGMTSLHYAAIGGHAAVAEVLLKKDAAVQLQRKFGETALHCAARRGHAAVVEVLLKNKAAVDLLQMKYGGTALHCAATGGHAAVVEVLLKNKAAVDLQHVFGGTALHSLPWTYYKRATDRLPSTLLLREAMPLWWRCS